MRRFRPLLVVAFLTLLTSLAAWAATARTDLTARLTGRMASTSFSFRDSPVVDGVWRVTLDNTAAPYIARATGTLAGSGTANLDTRGGLTLIDGSTSASLTTIKYLACQITNPAANQILKIGIGAANGLTTLVDTASAAFVIGGGIAGSHGGWMMASNPAGWATTAGTVDIIVLTNSGTASLDYECLLGGQ